jgi:hypothetical protein
MDEVKVWNRSFECVFCSCCRQSDDLVHTTCITRTKMTVKRRFFPIAASSIAAKRSCHERLCYSYACTHNTKSRTVMNVINSTYSCGCCNNLVITDYQPRNQIIHNAVKLLFTRCDNLIPGKAAACQVRQTRVPKHVWTYSNLRLHEPQTKWVVRSQAADEVVRICWRKNEWQESGAADKHQVLCEDS